MSTGKNIFVQLLPIIKNSSNASQNKILLCKWNQGPFKDRFTGLIKQMDFKAQDFPTSLSLRSRLELEAKSLIPKSPKVSFDVNLVAILEFSDVPACDEYVYLANLPEEEASKENLSFEGNPCKWFNWGQIPYVEMPADDPLWYPKVLEEGLKVTGTFSFGSWAEKELKSYEIKSVPFF